MVSKAQLRRLFKCLQVPAQVSFNDGQRSHKFGGEEVLLFSLEYLASGNTIESIIRHQFGRDITQWSRDFHWFIQWIADRWGHLLHLSVIQVINQRKARDHWVTSLPNWCRRIDSIVFPDARYSNENSSTSSPPNLWLLCPSLKDA
jgi:hypothetical protein